MPPHDTSVPCGPDPAFPYLHEHERLRFPAPEDAPDSVVAYGGNLSPGMILSAYEQGIFPWYNPGDPVIWQSPDPRFVLFPENLHVSHSMRKVLRKETFTIRFNYAFPAVIASCAAPRGNDAGTWITGDMMAAYEELHRLGYAHSAESYLDNRLVGGCYGILLGRVFFGESMFTHVKDASKTAFLTLAEKLFSSGIAFIDCQVWSAHLESLGAVELRRRDFLRLLRNTPLSGYNVSWLAS